MANLYDVFLSHSSADKSAVEKLAHKLLDLGVKPFFDKWELIPGRLWQTDLENGLRDSSACVIFVGTEGIGPWHRQEMLVALDRGARDSDYPVIPVLLPDFKKPTAIPSFLAQRGWVEFSSLNDEEAIHRLVSGIHGKAPGPGLGITRVSSSYRCMAQPPEGFIYRGEYDAVLDALCPRDGTSPSSLSVGITTALRGAGGFGKTALAQAICFEEKIRQHYPDGILWTTMGENLDSEGRLSRILDLIRWWTDKEPPGFKDSSTAGAKLWEILKGQRILLVLDDVWSPADVAPFQGSRIGAAVLITTRDSQTLPENSLRIEVDALAFLEALSLLRSGLAAESSENFVSLAAGLGEWPLLLKLVNRQLRELVKENGLSITDALQEIESALDSEGFSAFDRDDPESRNAAASQAILVSVRRLPERERNLYFQLAVFPEDTEISVSILEGYWGLSRFATRKLCGRLHDLSLLRDFDVKKGSIRLHDVIRKILIEQIGDGISSLHSRLLESHRPTSIRWADLEEENQYLWRNLAGHLLGAGRSAELRDLLADFSFLEVKLKVTDINALISDYASFVGEEQEFRLIQDALRLSAHILGRDRRQLAPQLLGRLLGRKEEHIRRLLDGASSWQGEYWLRPRRASFTQPGGALIRVLEGHTGGVNAVAAMDGRRVVSASKDRTLRIWDLESGRILQSLEGHADSVSAVAVLDSGRIVSASVDGSLRVWDLESGQTIQTFEGHTGSVRAVVVLDDRHVVSASDDGSLRVWSLESGRTLRTLRGHVGSVRSVAVLDGRCVVSASTDGSLRVWDLESGRSLQTLEGHTGVFLAVAVLDGGHVVSASAVGTLQVWDLGSGRILQTLKGHTDAVFSMAVLPGARLVSASADRSLRVWDLESGRTLQTLEGQTGVFLGVAVLDGGRVVSASSAGMLQVWGLESCRALQTLKGHTSWVLAVAGLSGGRVVSTSADGMLQVWDLGSGGTLQTLEGPTSWVFAVAELDDGRVVSASYDGRLLVLDLENGQILETLRGPTSWVFAVAMLAGRRIVSASAERTLVVWDLESGRILQTLEGHEAWIRAIAVLDDGRIVSASDDQTLRVWDLEGGRTHQVLNGHADSVHAVAVLDSQSVISASSDGTLRVWDLKSGRALRALEGHTARVLAVAALDGRRSVSASDDMTVRVWDVDRGEELTVLTLDAPPTAVAVSPDGQIVMAGDQSGTVHFFDWMVQNSAR